MMTKTYCQFNHSREICVKSGVSWTTFHFHTNIFGLVSEDYFIWTEVKAEMRLMPT